MVSGCQTCGGYGMHHDPVAHGTGPGPHHYENHQWTSNDPDRCARCGVDWDDADIACEEIQ